MPAMLVAAAAVRRRHLGRVACGLMRAAAACGLTAALVVAAALPSGSDAWAEGHRELTSEQLCELIVDALGEGVGGPSSWEQEGFESNPGLQATCAIHLGSAGWAFVWLHASPEAAEQAWSASRALHLARAERREGEFGAFFEPGSGLGEDSYDRGWVPTHYEEWTTSWHRGRFRASASHFSQFDGSREKAHVLAARLDAVLAALDVEDTAPPDDVRVEPRSQALCDVVVDALGEGVGEPLPVELSEAACAVDLGDGVGVLVVRYASDQDAQRYWTQMAGEDEAWASDAEDVRFELGSSLGEESYELRGPVPGDEQRSWRVTRVLRGPFIADSGSLIAGAPADKQESHALAVRLDEILVELADASDATPVDGLAGDPADEPALAAPDPMDTGEAGAARQPSAAAPARTAPPSGMAGFAFLITIAGIGVALVTARRPAPVRVWIDVVRVVIAAATTATLGGILGIAPSGEAVGLALLLGAALGWVQGATSTVWAEEGVVLARRRIAGVAVWGAAVLAVKAAAFADLASPAAVGQLLAWFGVGVLAAIPLARRGPARQALAGATAAAGAALLIAAPVAVVASSPAAADSHHELTSEQLCDLIVDAMASEFDLIGAEAEPHEADRCSAFIDGFQFLVVVTRWPTADRAAIEYRSSNAISEGAAGVIAIGSPALGDESISYMISTGAESGEDSAAYMDSLRRGSFVVVAIGENQARVRRAAVLLDLAVAELLGAAPAEEGATESAADPPVGAAEPEQADPAADDEEADPEPDGEEAEQQDRERDTEAAETEDEGTESLQAGRAEMVSAVSISREDAEEAAAAGAGGAAALGALSVLEASPGRRRRRLVTVGGATPAPGQVVEVDEADRHDLHTTSGGQKATDEEQFGTHGRVVRPVLRVEDAEPGPGGERDGLTVVEVEEATPSVPPPPPEASGPPDNEPQRLDNPPPDEPDLQDEENRDGDKDEQGGDEDPGGDEPQQLVNPWLERPDDRQGPGGQPGLHDEGPGDDEPRDQGPGEHQGPGGGQARRDEGPGPDERPDVDDGPGDDGGDERPGDEEGPESVDQRDGGLDDEDRRALREFWQGEVERNARLAQRELGHARLMDWLGWGADWVEWGADKGVDLLSRMTGPKGKAIEEVYKNVKRVAAGIGEFMATGDAETAARNATRKWATDKAGDWLFKHKMGGGSPPEPAKALPWRDALKELLADEAKDFTKDKTIKDTLKNKIIEPVLRSAGDGPSTDLLVPLEAGGLTEAPAGAAEQVPELGG